MREIHNSIQKFNDIQLKLIEGGEWRATASSGPQTDEEWFRLQRYMGLLEQIYLWHRDRIIDLDEIDSGYSHRFKSIVSHPVIRQRLLNDEAFRWKQFNALVAKLETMPVFEKLQFSFPSQQQEVSSTLQHTS